MRKRKTLNLHPKIELFSEVISDEECLEVVSLAKPGLRIGGVNSSNHTSLSKTRTNSVSWLRVDQSPIIASVFEKVAKISKHSPNACDRIQVARYLEGQYFNTHMDAFNLKTEFGKQQVRRHGQRLLTALCYLNDGFVGGETIFPELLLSIPPKRGDVLVFENCIAGTIKPDRSTRHMGNVVKGGEKWVCNFWFHGVKQKTLAPN